MSCLESCQSPVVQQKIISGLLVTENSQPVMSADGERYIIHGEDENIYQVSKDMLEQRSLPTILQVYDVEGNVTVLYISKDSSGSSGKSDTPEGRVPPKKWTEAETKCLLALYSELYPQVKSRKISSAKKMWPLIAQKMSDAGFHCNAFQAENRWKTLDRAYKKTEQNDKDSGRGRIDFYYQSEMDDILLKRPNINPHILKGPGTTVKRPRTAGAEPPGVDPEPVSSLETTDIPTQSAETPEAQVAQEKSKRDRGRSTTTAQEIALFRKTYEEALEKKENHRERRHQEKMSLLKELFNSKKD